MYRYRCRRTDPRQVMAAGALGFAVTASLGARAAAAVHHHHSHHATVTAARGEPKAAARAIAYAKAQLGKPYLWGGTGPDAFDCSGLTQMAYAHAGVSIERTAAEQWASLPHVPRSQVDPGDLVFFPGADGSWSSPGHVALVISKSKMIQAYGSGVPIEVSPLSGAGSGGIIGFADPVAGS